MTPPLEPGRGGLNGIPHRARPWDGGDQWAEFCDESGLDADELHLELHEELTGQPAPEAARKAAGASDRWVTLRSGRRVRVGAQLEQFLRANELIA